VLAHRVRALHFYGGVPQLIVPANPRAVIATPDRYEPRANDMVLDLRVGALVQSWPHIASGSRTTSIFGSSSNTPVMVHDSAGRRYAFADDSGITVLRFDRASV
jgi:hypothetical protein